MFQTFNTFHSIFHVNSDNGKSVPPKKDINVNDFNNFLLRQNEMRDTHVTLLDWLTCANICHGSWDR